MKNKIFNLVTYSFLAYSILCAVFVSLPQEYQDTLPQFNWLTALISGGSTALIGTGGIVISSLMNKTKQETSLQFTAISEKYIEMKNSYHSMKNELESLKQEYMNINNSIKRNNQLLEADIKAKLSNPLIDSEVKKIIEGITNE